VDNFTRFKKSDRLVSIGSHRLYIQCMGERQPGQPVVILEAGHSDWSHCWPKVQPEIARFTRVIAYDRAGFGWSERGPQPRTPLRLVGELHELLARSGECGPYIFVGHSLGAALGRLFAGLYPGEIVGMVWVDSAHEQMQRYMSFWPAAYLGLVASGSLGALLARVGLVRAAGRGLMLANTPLAQTAEEQAILVDQMSCPGFFETLRNETLGWYPPENWARTPRSFGDLPVIMIEAQYPPKAPRGYPPQQWKEFRLGWSSIQTDLSALSTRTQRVPVISSHNVMCDQPAAIVQAVKDVFALVTGQVRSGTRTIE
jgi:pimeloyl-ACP methyl ester carboxylesterase